MNVATAPWLIPSLAINKKKKKWDTRILYKASCSWKWILRVRRVHRVLQLTNPVCMTDLPADCQFHILVPFKKITDTSKRPFPAFYFFFLSSEMSLRQVALSFNHFHSFHSRIHPTLSIFLSMFEAQEIKLEMFHKSSPFKFFFIFFFFFFFVKL